jgi:hypothetical protein
MGILAKLSRNWVKSVQEPDTYLGSKLWIRLRFSFASN